MRRRGLPGRPGRRLAAALLAVLLALAGGCAVYQEPGANPARLGVSARASVTPAQVADALERQAHLKYAALGGVEEVSEPLWDLRAFVPRPDGGLTPLKPLQPVENFEGHDFAARAEFLAPAGTYPVFLLLECSVRHVDLSGPVPVVEYIYILTWRRQQTVELCPGCRLELNPFAQPASQP
ncbi:MAG: hypothetical protein V1806_13055 [Pseudomonadota bacterium]